MDVNHAPIVLELLDDAPFPLTKPELVAYAEDHDASEEALEVIRVMPDRVYNSVEHVNAGLGLIEDLPHTDNGWWSGEEPDLKADERRKKVTDTKGRGQV